MKNTQKDDAKRNNSNDMQGKEFEEVEKQNLLKEYAYEMMHDCHANYFGAFIEE